MAALKATAPYADVHRVRLRGSRDASVPVTVSVQADLPVPASRAWEVITAYPTPPELYERAPLLEFRLPGSPVGTVGERTCMVARGPDRCALCVLMETVELTPGRRVVTRITVEARACRQTYEVEPTASGCRIRVSLADTTTRRRQEAFEEGTRAALTAGLWRLRRYLGDASAGAAQPALAPRERAILERHHMNAAQLEIQQELDVKVTARVELPVPRESVWALLADPDSGAPWLHGGRRFPLPGSPPGLGQVWVTLGETVSGDPLAARFDEVEDLAPGRSLVIKPRFVTWPATVTLALEDRPGGCRLEVTVRGLLPWGVAWRTRRLWRQLARGYAARLAAFVAAPPSSVRTAG